MTVKLAESEDEGTRKDSGALMCDGFMPSLRVMIVPFILPEGTPHRHELWVR